jgi:cobalt-zinc-cadmium efflux system outer membrane protein
LNSTISLQKPIATAHDLVRRLPWLFSSILLIWSAAASAAPDQPEQQIGTELATLPRVVALAQQNAPNVVVGRSAKRASEASLVGARVWPVQNPYFEITATRTTSSMRDGTLMLGTAWLPFEVTGQRGRRISEAESFVAMHELDVHQARAQAAGSAIRAWGRALVETARIHTLQEIAASAGSEARAFRARRDVGDATERDAQLAEVELARHRVLVEEAKVSLHSAIAEMRRLTGRNWYVAPQAHVRAGRDLDKLDPALAAAQSPFVKSGRVEADYFSRQDERLSSETLGPVSLILSGGHGTTGENVFGAGVAISLPTFRRHQGERARAQRERDRAMVESDVTRKDVERRLSAIVQEARGVRQIAEVLDTQALPAAQAARRASEQMFEMGKVDILSVLVSRRDEALLRLKQLDLAEREWDLIADWAELTGVVP